MKTHYASGNSICLQSFPIPSTMNSLAALASFLAVATTLSVALDVVPPPARPIGAFGIIILDLQRVGDIYSKKIDASFVGINEEIGKYIQEHGGLNGDLNDYLAFENVTETFYWQSIEDDVNDIAWNFDQQLADALDNIEREFALVINQPLVRSWLRQLRQIGRIAQNRALASVHQRRAEDIALSEQFNQQAVEFIRNSKCSGSQALLEGYTKIVNNAMHELAKIKEALKKDQEIITNDMINLGLALTNNIYQVEIEALRYFIS